MTDLSRDDPIWQAALGWVMREHEKALNDAELIELKAWLMMDAAHRSAYRQAQHLWSITGMVPPSSSS
ncbi:FecR/PupR family sigma factor regulator [Paucibacter sp. XJ19-41]|uniref:FecR/PupR family sigma factor regulator n=1 Tax=Paucibacter sp. XJ19-41 TaxID=2927824 RepID=UPI00234BD6AF|nr:DUF4880 domain-containing protein [Paucibacter sp. XJ19-41]MDC6169385.1 DUF4880 domain-containing protein [Paucibacter sp. XJ19-41]